MALVKCACLTDMIARRVAGVFGVFGCAATQQTRMAAEAPAQRTGDSTQLVAAARVALRSGHHGAGSKCAVCLEGALHLNLLANLERAEAAKILEGGRSGDGHGDLCANVSAGVAIAAFAADRQDKGVGADAGDRPVQVLRTLFVRIVLVVAGRPDIGGGEGAVGLQGTVDLDRVTGLQARQTFKAVVELGV